MIMGYEDEDRTAVSTPTTGSRFREEGVEPTQSFEMDQAQLGASSRGGKSDRSGLKRRSSRGVQESAKMSEKEVKEPRKEVPVAVVEQRVSNLAQGVLCKSSLRSRLMTGLVLMTKPFQHVLGLIPKGVMAGLFVS